MSEQLSPRRAEYQTRADVYTRVTNQIVQAIEAGANTYTMPWHNVDAQFPRNAVTGKRYRGVNVLSLASAAYASGYPEAIWATYQQWGDLGHQVRRGEHSAIGVFWKPKMDRDESTQKADEQRDLDTSSSRWIARAFPLFNAAQVEGYEPPKLPARPDHERIAHAETFVAALRADVRHGGNRAFYRPSSDHIQMPQFEAFVDSVSYYGTMMHEVTHWTGHSSRLDRELKNRFGSETYAAEELIAELGAAFISADLELSPEPKAESAAYIDNWLAILKSDKRAIFTAAGHAQRAADYLHGLQPQPCPDAAPLTDAVMSAPNIGRRTSALKTCDFETNSRLECAYDL